MFDRSFGDDWPAQRLHSRNPFLVVPYHRKDVFSKFGCQISGFFMHFLTYVSIATMTLTAINRYVCVLKPNDVSRKRSSYNRSMLYIASLWAFVALVALLAVVSGSSIFAFNPVTASCIMKFTTRNAEIGLTFFIGAFFVLCCLIIISVCYFRVYRFISHHNMNTISQLSMQEINLAKTLFVLVLTFAALWIPDAWWLSLPVWCWRQNFSVSLFWSSSALNPWVYGVMCPVVCNKMKTETFLHRGRGSTVSTWPERMVVNTLAPPRRKSSISNITYVSDLANASFLTNLPGALAQELPWLCTGKTAVRSNFQVIYPGIFKLTLFLCFHQSSSL